MWLKTTLFKKKIITENEPNEISLFSIFSLKRERLDSLAPASVARFDNMDFLESYHVHVRVHVHGHVHVRVHFHVHVHVHVQRQHQHQHQH